MCFYIFIKINLTYICILNKIITNYKLNIVNYKSLYNSHQNCYKWLLFILNFNNFFFS